MTDGLSSYGVAALLWTEYIWDPPASLLSQETERLLKGQLLLDVGGFGLLKDMDSCRVAFVWKRNFVWYVI